jgi:hypothetical protein
MMESVLRLAKQMVNLVNSKVETRLQELMDSGVALNKLSLRHHTVPMKTIILVDGVPDSEIWITQGENTVSVHGRSLKEVKG